MAVKEGKMIQRITQILKAMENFYRSKKNMFLLIREGITEVKGELGRLRRYNTSDDSFLLSLEYFLGMQDT